MVSEFLHALVPEGILRGDIQLVGSVGTEAGGQPPAEGGRISFFLRKQQKSPRHLICRLHKNRHSTETPSRTTLRAALVAQQGLLATGALLFFFC